MVKGFVLAIRKLHHQKEMIKINDFKALIENKDLERPNLFSVKINPPKAVFRETYVDVVNLKTQWNRLSAGRDLTLLCQSVNVPSVALNMSAGIQRQSIGPITRYPVRAMFSDVVTMTFLSDASSMAYDFFYAWLNFISPTNGAPRTPDDRKYLMEYKDNYASNEIEINAYRGVKGKYAKPTSMGDAFAKTLTPANASALLAGPLARATGGLSLTGNELAKKYLFSQEYDLEIFKTFKLVNSYPISIGDIAYNAQIADAINTFTVEFVFDYMAETSVDGKEQSEKPKESEYPRNRGIDLGIPRLPT